MIEYRYQIWYGIRNRLREERNTDCINDVLESELKQEIKDALDKAKQLAIDNVAEGGDYYRPFVEITLEIDTQF